MVIFHSYVSLPEGIWVNPRKYILSDDGLKVMAKTPQKNSTSRVQNQAPVASVNLLLSMQ